MLEGYFPDFMAFFFPEAYEDIDWTRGFSGWISTQTSGAPASARSIAMPPQMFGLVPVIWSAILVFPLATS